MQIKLTLIIIIEIKAIIAQICIIHQGFHGLVTCTVLITIKA